MYNLHLLKLKEQFYIYVIQFENNIEISRFITY
jgi:hypothetical protein